MECNRQWGITRACIGEGQLIKMTHGLLPGAGIGRLFFPKGPYLNVSDIVDCLAPEHSNVLL